MGYLAKILMFFTLQTLTIFIQLVFNALVGDVSSATRVEQQRQEVQRIRLFDRFDRIAGHTEFNEEIKVQGSPDQARFHNHTNVASFNDIAKLQPKDDMYIKPLL